MKTGAFRRCQGNGHLARGEVGSLARAVRRYAEGAAALAGGRVTPTTVGLMVDMGVSIAMGYPNGWIVFFLGNTQSKMDDDWGYPYLRKPPSN